MDQTAQVEAKKIPVSVPASSGQHALRPLEFDDAPASPVHSFDRISVSPPSLDFVSGRGAPAVLQRKCARCNDDDEEGLHRKEARDQEMASGLHPDASSVVHEVLRSPGQPIDLTTRAFFEPRFGRNFSQVRIHTDPQASTSARAVNALAYTVGSHIVFGAKQYAPGTRAGTQLMAHELAHTVQDSGTGRLHAALRLGRPDDPSERAAERTAEAVLGGERVSLAPVAGGVIRRQLQTCVAGPADRPDRRIVRCPDGSEYRVTLTVTREPARPQTRTTVNAGWNNQDIWLDIGICRGGTDVTITPSIDLPRAIGQVLGNIVTGSGALSGVSVTPGLQITIVQSQSFTLTLEPNVTVGQSGVSGIGLGATVQTPDVTVGGSATYDPQTRTGWLTFTFSGGQSQRRVDCSSRPRQHLVFTCERITHVPAVPEVPEETVTDTETRYVFFDYKTDRIRRNFRLPTDIQSLYDAGYRLSTIEGFTSPEGPREAGPNFEGNIALGQERAVAAQTWLQEVCPACDAASITPRGRSELPAAVGAETPERRGPAMERDAVTEFLQGNPAAQTGPDPLAPTDPAEQAAFRRLPRAQQRERAFELMRRAAITFTRRRVTQQRQPAVPARNEFNQVECNPDAIDAARSSFGINILTGVPLTR